MAGWSRLSPTRKGSRSVWGCTDQSRNLLKRPGRQSAEEHSHYDNPTAFRVFKNTENAEPRNFQRRRPTLSSIPVVTGNRVGERFLPGDRSGPAHSPGSRERNNYRSKSRQEHAPNAIHSSCVAFSTLPSRSVAKPFPSLVSSNPARSI